MKHYIMKKRMYQPKSKNNTGRNSLMKKPLQMKCMIEIKEHYKNVIMKNRSYFSNQSSTKRKMSLNIKKNIRSLDLKRVSWINSSIIQTEEMKPEDIKARNSIR